MNETGKPREFSGRETSQGHIVLRSLARKPVFVAGLAGIVLLAVLLAVAGCVPAPLAGA